MKKVFLCCYRIFGGGVRRTLGKLRAFRYARNLSKRIRKEQMREETLVLSGVTADKYSPLTEAEKSQIKSFWGEDIVRSYRECEVYKKACGFDVRFMPMSFYLPLITRRLNNYFYGELMEDKGLLGRLSPGSIRFPVCFVRTIGGEYFDRDFRQITEDAARAICLGLNEFVVKAAVGGHGGAGVEKVSLRDLSMDERTATVNQIFTRRKNNILVQEVLREHISLARFNPSSVNTLRVQSLYLNGEVDVLHIILRMGTPGSFVDNSCSGGCSVGVSKEGYLCDYGFTSIYDRIYESGDVTFKGTRLEQIPKLIEFIKTAHVKQFPMIKYIGWDMIFDENNDPVCIEVNTRSNGHLSFQLCDGPTFGDRTDEVISYCKEKKFHY